MAGARILGVVIHQEILCKANPRLGSLVALIHLRSTSGQPKLPYAPPEPHLSNSILIYQNPVQPVHTQILNKNPQLIWSLIDLPLQSAVNFSHTQIFIKNLRLIWSLIDLLLRSAVTLSHTQILNKNPRLIWSLMNLSLRSAVNLVHTLIFNNHPRLILSLVDLPLRSAVNLFKCKSFTAFNYASLNVLVGKDRSRSQAIGGPLKRSREAYWSCYS